MSQNTGSGRIGRAPGYELPDPPCSDASQWGPQEWADVALYGTCQQCGWPRTARTTTTASGTLYGMACGKDASHAA